MTGYRTAEQPRKRSEVIDQQHRVKSIYSSIILSEVQSQRQQVQEGNLDIPIPRDAL